MRLTMDPRGSTGDARDPGEGDVSGGANVRLASCRARPVSANECGVYREQYRSVGEFTRSPIAHHNPTRASRIIDPDRNAVESVRLKNALGSPDGSEQLAELHRARSMDLPARGEQIGVQERSRQRGHGKSLGSIGALGEVAPCDLLDFAPD
jgi:hypothetical protein